MPGRFHAVGIGSLMHLAGILWARTGEQVRRDGITITSRVYTHVITGNSTTN